MEFYREMMEHFQAESASKSAQLSALLEENRALREEMAAMRLSHKEDMDSLKESHWLAVRSIERSHKQAMESLEKSHKEAMDKLRASFEKRLEHMAQINADFSVQLRDALNSGKLARERKYGRSSEQRDLFNNRREV